MIVRSPAESSSRGRGRGAALLLVLVLVVVALAMTGVIVALSQRDSTNATERLAETQARYAAQSALAASLDALNHTGAGDVDGRVDSLASIHAATGTALDLRGLPDGSFTVRARVSGADAGGAYYVVTAYAKWGSKAKGFSGIAKPATKAPFPAAFFGDAGLSVAGQGVVEAYDSSAADPTALVPATDLLASNGNISIGNSAATGGGGGKAGSGAGGAQAPAKGGGGPALSAATPPFFLGSLYAPLADIHVAPTGGGPTGTATCSGQWVNGNVVAGPSCGTTEGPNAAVAGRVSARAAKLALAAPATTPPAGSTSAGPLSVAAPCTIAGGVTVVDSLAVTSTLTISGAVDLYVTGDATISGVGSIALAAGAALRLFVGGSLTLGGAGIANPGPASRVAIVCGADSVATPGAGVLVNAAGAFSGGAIGRTLKVTGTPFYLRYDAALGAASAPAATYAITNVIEVAPPW